MSTITDSTLSYRAAILGGNAELIKLTREALKNDLPACVDVRHMGHDLIVSVNTDQNWYEVLPLDLALLADHIVQVRSDGKVIVVKDRHRAVSTELIPC